MEKLIAYIEENVPLAESDLTLLTTVFTPLVLPAKSVFIEAGKAEHYLYFLVVGIVKGYKNEDGEIVVEHLVEDGAFLTSVDSFFYATSSNDFFETVTDCKLLRVSREDFNRLRTSSDKWGGIIEAIRNENLRCKMERVNDFQTLNATERYLKFLNRSSNLALKVSVEDIASYLGVKPPSLSRIRRQIAS